MLWLLRVGYFQRFGNADDLNADYRLQSAKCKVKFKMTVVPSGSVGD